MIDSRRCDFEEKFAKFLERSRFDQTNFECVYAAAIFTTNEIKWIHFTKGMVQLKRSQTNGLLDSNRHTSKLGYTNTIQTQSIRLHELVFLFFLYFFRAVKMSFKQNPIKELKFLETSLTYSVFLKDSRARKSIFVAAGDLI